jgi:DNA-binding response OmpR family regulator
MLSQQSVLVVEDDPYLALDLQQTLEDFGGRVVGPTRRLSEARELIASRNIAAAIVDCHVPDEDMLPLADLLAKRGVPFLLHATGHMLQPGWDQHREVPVLVKPVQARTVVARLMVEMRRSARR